MRKPGVPPAPGPQPAATSNCLPPEPPGDTLIRDTKIGVTSGAVTGLISEGREFPRSQVTGRTGNPADLRQVNRRQKTKCHYLLARPSKDIEAQEAIDGQFLQLFQEETLQPRGIGGTKKPLWEPRAVGDSSQWGLGHCISKKVTRAFAQPSGLSRPHPW